MAKKSNNTKIILLLVGGIIVSLCLCLSVGVYIIGDLANSGSVIRTSTALQIMDQGTITSEAVIQTTDELQPIVSTIIPESDTIYPTKTPIFMINSNSEEYDGVTFTITDIEQLITIIKLICSSSIISSCCIPIWFPKSTP